MYCVLISFLLLLIRLNENEVEAIDIYDIRDELPNFNIKCPRDSCREFQLGSLSSRHCLCGIECIQLGACCVDSIYAAVQQPKLKPACRSIKTHESYFMVDQCPYDNIWRNLCNPEWNEEDDVQMIVPVTSLSTSITYKNYYCLRCHETSEDFLYWKLWMEGNSTLNEKPKFESLSLTYSKDLGTWMAIYDENIGYIPVNVTILAPFEIQMILHDCKPNIISECSSNWRDEEVRSKCHSYMAIKEVTEMGAPIKYYKNIHCALCNFENLTDIKCRIIVPSGSGAGAGGFSFTHLLDINRSDGEMVGKIQKCSEDDVWDPFTKKCRKLTCALPGQKVKNGKCVQE